jgi:hypothetical protein
MFEQYMMTRSEKSVVNGTLEAKISLSITKVGQNDMDVDNFGHDVLELLWIQIQGLKDENYECPLLEKHYEEYSDIMLQAVIIIYSSNNMIYYPFQYLQVLPQLNSITSQFFGFLMMPFFNYLYVFNLILRIQLPICRLLHTLIDLL